VNSVIHHFSDSECAVADQGMRGTMWHYVFINGEVLIRKYCFTHSRHIFILFLQEGEAALVNSILSRWQMAEIDPVSTWMVVCTSNNG
jgi:hypothetical protein